MGNFISDAVNDAASSASDYWSKRGPHYKADEYQIDPNAFVNPHADANRTAWDAAVAAANGQGAGYFGDEEKNLAEQLKARANGTAPSLARMALKDATDRNLAHAAGLMTTARGINPALAARNVAYNQANIAQEAAGQGTQAELAERMASENALANLLAQGRGQDLTQRGQNLQTGVQYAGLENSMDQGSLAAQIAGQQLGSANHLGTEQINSNASQANNALGLGILGSAFGGGGSLFSNLIPGGAAGGAAAAGPGAGALAGGGAAAAGGGMAGGAGAGLMAALAGGGVVPGPDAGRDDKLIAARGQEVVVNPENPEYARARAAVANPSQTGFAMDSAVNPGVGGPMDRATRGGFRGPGPGTTPTYPGPMSAAGGAPAGMPMMGGPSAAPMGETDPMAAAQAMGRRVLQWIKTGAKSTLDVLDSPDIGGIGIERSGHPSSSGSSAHFDTAGSNAAYRGARDPRSIYTAAVGG